MSDLEARREARRRARAEREAAEAESEETTTSRRRRRRGEEAESDEAVDDLTQESPAENPAVESSTADTGDSAGGEGGAPDFDVDAMMAEAEKQRQEEQEKKRQEAEERLKLQREQEEKEAREREEKEQREREEEERKRREQEEKERKKREEEEEKKRIEEEKKQKRKAFGGLTPEKKKLLKQLIMQRAQEIAREEALKREDEKRRFIEGRLPKKDYESMGAADLERKVKELFQKMCHLEDEKFEYESRVRKQDYEINELTIKVNDTKGKFIKPVLKKVSKTESKLAKFTKHQDDRADFRENLKSIGHSKYEMEDQGEVEEKPGWRESLKSAKEGEEEA